MIKNEKEAFEMLNQELKKENMCLTIICVGGFVLFHNDIRATQDIDAFYESSQKVEDVIRFVGDKLSLNTDDELWINNSVQNLNKRPPEDICETLYEFSNLLVKVAPILYVAWMKLNSARGQDIKDVAEIIKKQNLLNPEELRDAIGKFNLPMPDESLLLEAFGEAYGMEWLESYFVKNEKKILERI